MPRTQTLSRKTILLATGVVITAALFSGCNILFPPITPEINKEVIPEMDEDKMMEDKNMMEKDTMMEGEHGDTMMKDEKMMKDDAMMEKKGEYAVYDASGSQLAMADSGKVVLFFNASWCPNCRTLETDINAHLSTIPANTHILSVDYDTYADLKTKYGVTYQHTFVQVDANGNQIKKWNGGSTLAEVLKHL